jgi:hypothetical protein
MHQLQLLLHEQALLTARRDETLAITILPSSLAEAHEPLPKGD